MSKFSNECLLDVNDMLSLESDDTHLDKDSGFLFQPQDNKNERFGVANDEVVQQCTNSEFTRRLLDVSTPNNRPTPPSGESTLSKPTSSRNISSSSEQKETSDSESVFTTGQPYMSHSSQQNMSAQPQKTSQDWITFDETDQVFDSPPPSSITSPAPNYKPTIPSRKSSSNVATNLDLLLMDDQSLKTHLEHSVDVPPIPDRLLSPTRLPSTSSSARQSPISCEFRLPPPTPSGSFSRRTPRARTPHNNIVKESVGLNSLSANKVPPVPPRKDLLADQSRKLKMDCTPPTTEPDAFQKDTVVSSGVNWIKFDNKSSLDDTPKIDAEQLDIESRVVQSDIDELDTVDDATLNQWPAPLPGTPKSARRKKRGYQHLPHHSDDETPEKPVVQIEVTDLSPMKPLSRWAPIRNEADEAVGSSGNVSAHNSLSDNIAGEDLDLEEDDFALNRLSAEMNSLRGFNRADKGSQNNLVDFSGTDDKPQGSIQSSACSSADEETIFDMTAKGDSLKRKRRKKLKEGESSCDVSGDAVQPDGVEPTNVQSCGNIDSMLPPTNPFWTASPIGDTVSLASSAGEGNPFDKIQFQTLTSTPRNIPAIPPPPVSGKTRSTSGSNRRRMRDGVSPCQPSLSESDAPSDISEQKSITATNLTSSVFNTPTKEPDKTPDDKKTPAEAKTPGQQESVEVAKFNPSSQDSSNNPPSFEDKTILETTLSLLDGFPQPLDEVKLPNVDVRTCNALQLDTSFPSCILREKSLDSLEKLQKAISVESPQPTDGDKGFLASPSVEIIPRLTEWSLLMRFPHHKRVMSTRRWVSVYVRLNNSKPGQPSLQLFHTKSSKDPFYAASLSQHDWQITEPTIQPRFTSSDNLSDVDALEAAKRKVHTIKLLHVRYKEKVAFSAKQDKILKRPPAGFKHSLKWKEAVKLGTEKYGDLCSLVAAIKDSSFEANKMSGMLKTDEHSPIVKYHSRDEIIFDCRDQFTGIVSSSGEIKACHVAVNIFVTAFLSGDPMATVTLNDAEVEGREVVRREDIMASSNERWVRIGGMEVHKCSAPPGYNKESASLSFYPPDACRFQLAKFHCSYNEASLPITVKVTAVVKHRNINVRCILRSSGTHSSNKDPLTQVPCEDLSIRLPIPHQWIGAFRRTGRFRIRSIHAKRVLKRSSAHDASSLGNAHMEASVGSAKYEAAYGAIVWRLPRFPEKNAAQNIPQVFSCTVDLPSDHLPSREVMGQFTTCEVEYTMPCATASGACVRSIYLPNTKKAEKFTTYSARYFYKVDMSIKHEPETNNRVGPDCTVQ